MPKSIESKHSRPMGRPRDEAVSPALLAAARHLVLAHGYRNVSIQMIVDGADVSRQTLYRRWSSKAELVLDAFYESAGAPDVPEGRPLAETLQTFFSQVFERLSHDRPAIRNLSASAQEDPAFLESFRSRFVQPRADMVADFIRTAQKRGEVPADADVEMAVIMLHGGFWYQLLLDQPLDDALAHRLTTLILQGLKARQTA